jgi:hypothetical protein
VNRNDRTGLCDADICVDAWGWADPFAGFWESLGTATDYGPGEAYFCMTDPACYSA